MLGSESMRPRHRQQAFDRDCQRLGCACESLRWRLPTVTVAQQVSFQNGSPSVSV